MHDETGRDVAVMTYTAWGRDGQAFEFGPGTEPSPVWDDEDGPPEIIWMVEAESWEDACRRYHEFQGWEPYVPMGGPC